MAHVQRRCSRRDCRKAVPQGARGCSACGARRTVWFGRVRGPDGVERSKSFRTRVEAERFVAGSEVSRARGEWIDPAQGRIPLREWADAWLEAVRPALKPKTVRSYESLVNSRLSPALGGRSISGLSPIDVQRWINAMLAEGLSPSRIRQAHVVLSQILKAGVQEGRIGRNVALGTKLPPIPREEAEYFDPDVVERIAEGMREPYDLFVRLLGTLGPRFGEGAALRRRSVNLLKKRLAIEESLAEVSGRLIFGPTKTHAMRKVPITPRLGEGLKRHLATHVGAQPDALLFTSPRGAPLRYKNFRERMWDPVLEKLGLPPVGVHVLRHSAAAALIRSGAPATAVQKILGHRSAAFTLSVYGHIFDEDLDLIAENLDQIPPDERRRAGGGRL